MAGMIKILIFMLVLILLFWGLNTYKHIRSGSWTKLQKVTDLTGGLLLAGVIISMIIPLISS